MLDRADVALLTAVLLVLFGSYLYARVILRHDGSKIQKYKLYKVRDDLIFLVASGKIEEEDFVFKYFYTAVTFMIKQTETLTLRSLVSALNDARLKGLDPAANEFVATLNDELPKRDPDVRRVVAEFYQAVLDILIENSFALRLVSKYAWIPNVFIKVRSWLSGVVNFPPQSRAYSFYREYKYAAARTTARDAWLAAA